MRCVHGARQVMMKLKNSRNLDARQSMLLDNAYYAVRPPERVGARRKRRPPVHDYMRHLIHDRLATEQVKPVRRSPTCCYFLCALTCAAMFRLSAY